MKRKKYIVITKSGLDVFGPNSRRMCETYILQAVKKGSRPGYLSIAEDYPEETRCHMCAERADCPAVNTGVTAPCPYYHKEEQDMNEYRIELIDRNGNRQRDHIDAQSAQEAADKIRTEWKDCYIQRISLVVRDWQ